MAEDCTDADYLGAYSRFFAEFVARVNPYDQLPVSVNSYNVTDAEIVGEIINVTLQYLNQTQCPCSLQAHLAHQVIQEIKSMCKKQPEDCGFKSQEKTYTSLKLMQAITGKVNEICTRYLDNSRLALLPPPLPTPLPQVAAGGNKNCRRKMEDRYVVLHDLHATFGINDDSVANYYAVFDGHAGQDAAVYCATHLHQYLAESIFYPTNPERALRDAFVTTDAQFIEKSKTQKVGGGTTAVCTLLLNKKLYVSWVGDSSAMLIKRDSVVQLVNPHRLHREDEIQRIRKMGGVVMRSMGIMRVNGVLSVSRAIGDVRYKPFVSGDPEIKQFPLDGTEDFLVIATDGLTDYVGPTQILSVLYHEMHRNPNGLKRAHQILLQWAKHAGSKDNITLVVVLLTPASEIAARPPSSHPLHSSQVNDILEKMNSKEKPLFLEIDDAHNAINSNILKQAIISQDPRDHEDDGILAASNGKHENGDADYDYSDLGPETDVDAVDDVATTPVKNLSYEFYKDDDHHPDKDSNVLSDVEETTINDNHQPDAEESLSGADGNKLLDEIMAAKVVVQEQVSVQTLEEIREGVREQIEENANEEEAEMKDEDRAESPANKPLQRALTPEADNVADSEDSEDEWNYFRVDPNKQKDAATPADQLRERKNEGGAESPEDAWNNFGVDTSKEKNSAAPGNELQELKNEVKFDTPEDAWNCFGVGTNKQKDSTTPVAELQEIKNVEEVETQKDEWASFLQTSKLLGEDIDSKTQSQVVEGEDIKCESPKEEFPELIDTEISAEDRALVPEQKKKSLEEEEEEQKDMSFQLNPNAAEFVPVSPQFMNNRMNLAEDFPISGSPLKQVSEMDDIQVPSQSEFDEEVCRRPREVDAEDKEYQNGGDHSQRTDESDFIVDRQKVIAFPANLDDSEISSTKAEFGDESAASFLTASEFHRTGISAIDESFSSSERDYDIAKDPMAMSFTPSDFEAAFDKGVDLNAVHSLSNTDLDVKNGSIEEEEDEVLNAPFPEPHPELTTLASPEAEQATYTPAFPGEPAELVNLSAQQEDTETTFVEHADEPKAAVDLLGVQSESFQLEQEVTRSDHSPLTDNYSAECESEKEALSVDNEQPLSPSSIDIDETKPIDETSEDAAIPETTLQKEEEPAKEADTPSSLSPVPDTMEKEVAVIDEDDDVVAAVKDKESEVSSTSILSSLHADAPEFMPGHYSFHSVAEETDEVSKAPTAETDDVCQLSAIKTSDVCQPATIETDDVCQSSTTQADEVRQSLIMKADDVCQLSATETDDVCCRSPTIEMREVCHSPLLEAGDAKAPVAQNLDKDVESTEEKLIEMVSTEPAQENLLNFGELEEEKVCTKSPFEIPTPPSSPRIPDELAESVDDIICLVQSTTEEKAEEIVELKEAPVETEVSEAEAQEVEETVPKSALNLSESMQEFTGLESQLQPKLEETSVETPVSKIIPELQEEILKTEELKEAVESEKLVEPLIDMEFNIQEEKVKSVPSKVDEVPSELEAALSKVEEAPCKIDEVPSELEAAVSKVEEAPCKVDEISAELEAALLETAEAPCKVDEVPSELEAAVSKMEEAPRKVDEVTAEVEAALSKIEETPLTVEEALSKVEEAPLKIEEAPLKIEEAPLIIEEALSKVEEAPLKIEEVPPKIDEAPLKVEETPLIVEETPLIVEETPLKVEEAPLIVEETPLKVEEALSEVKEALSEAKEALSEVKEPATEIATEATESKVAEIAAVTAAAAAGAVAVAAAAQSKTKTKVAAKPTKTATAKTAQKSTPTSPSKAVTSTTKTSTQTAKKSATTTTARPKDLDAPKKATVSSTTAGKPPSAKPAAKTTAISSSTTKSTTKTSTSAASKPKPVTTTAAKPAASDKKPTTNGEVKSLSKPATAKPPTSKVSTTTKTSLVKTAASSTRVSAGTTTTTTKARPASVTTASKPSPAAKTSTAASTPPAARPKTAPVAGNPTKPRSLLTAKSPIIDKQVKETANKQISMARTSSGSKATSRLSASKTSTTSTVKRVSSVTKSTTAASPTKKLTAATKVTSRTAVSGKTTTAVEKRKVVLQNGVSENVELNTIIDDVPKKDLSPVVTPNDNQLIMSSD